MRLSKALGTLVAAATVIVAVTASADAPIPEPVLTASCSGGNATVTIGAQGNWHANKDAPWKWVEKPAVKAAVTDQHTVSFTGGGGACSGTIKAYVCTNNPDGTPKACKGPISVAVH